MASSGPLGVFKHREKMVSHYLSVREELRHQEMSIHSSLNSAVESVVKSKNVLLFKRMLSDIGYDDMGVVDSLVEGVK
eukprot:5354397-Karenia_brevis.AAC.1